MESVTQNPERWLSNEVRYPAEKWSSHWVGYTQNPERWSSHGVRYPESGKMIFTWSLVPRIQKDDRHMESGTQNPERWSSHGVWYPESRKMIVTNHGEYMYTQCLSLSVNLVLWTILTNKKISFVVEPVQRDHGLTALPNCLSLSLNAMKPDSMVTAREIQSRP